MDRDLTDFKFLGLWGIYKESWKVLFSFKKIFTQFALALIFPLVFIFLAEIQISDIVYYKLVDRRERYHREGLPIDWIAYWVFRAAYVAFLVIVSLLSTAAVIYTIACIYTGKSIGFKKVMSVVPKIWKRLIITFFWNFLILIVYHVLMGIALLIWATLLVNIRVFGTIVIIVLVIMYLIGLVYFNVIWQLASVVSVLEDIYGIKAMKKSRTLIKGKMFAASFIFVVMEGFLIGVELVFWIFVMDDFYLGIFIKILIGIGCFLLAVFVILYGLVTQTVIYFVCKAYHQENIDKTILGNHLDGYTYVQLGGRIDFQLQQMNNV